ncbi:MAG: PQQ-binding-like beta-propeller repeat protein [Verrucomicrobia bacterium]|nr:PQQ-binding-like beta-propeller repeat protein [Verrucomicrobiota bacterium]
MLLATLPFALILRGGDRGEDCWPQFRGPGGSGVSRSGDFPVHFGPNSNVLWKVILPAGHSSPCIWRDRIFLTGADNGKLETLCIDRADGKILWRRAIEPEKIDRGSQNSSPAASTPATDGARVYVYFGSFGLIAYDIAGQEQWRKPLPIPITQHGASTSPVVAGDRLLLASDQDVGSYLLAADCRTGKTLWKAERPGFRRGFSTPLLYPGDRPELAIVAGTLRLVAYDLKSGTERWSVSGLPNEMVASPVAGDGLIFVAGWTFGAGVPRLPAFDALLEQGDQDKDGKLSRAEAPPGPAQQQFLYLDADKDGFITRQEYESLAKIFAQSQNALLAVRPGGRGDVTATHVAWKQTRGLPYVPSPLCYDGRIYLVKNGGLASCFDARTGKMFYQEERLGALGDYYSSPVAAGGKICVASQPGVVVVFQAGDALQVLARNALDEPIMATPAIIGHQLYVRTQGHLYAFGK